MARPRGLLLVNLGTPAAPTTAAVRRYLREFLSDPRVIDIAPWKRSLLVNGVIVPFRSPRSAEAYRAIWTEEGSPLLVFGRALAAGVQAALAGEADGPLAGPWQVELAMRYQEPGIGEALRRLQAGGVDEVVVLPLFPHYASSSWGSAVEKLYAEAGALPNVPALSVLPVYYEHPAFVRAFAAVTRPVLERLQPDKLLLSYHGLPERHMRAADFSGQHCLASAGCCDAILPANRACYRAQCYATTRALTRELGLAPERYETSFQSRLGRDPWIQPFTDVRLRELPGEGVKRLAVVVPSFVADCLETLEEIAIRGKEDFLANGGEALELVPSLNGHPAWVEGVLALVREHLGARAAS